MGGSVSPDWKMTRLVVVLIAILGPIYFFILVWLLPFQISLFQNPLLDWWFHYTVVPAVFSAPWLGIIYNSRYRLANTVYLMQETTDAVPLRWRVFYGSNAAFILMFFILPVVTAPLAIIGGLFVAGRVFYQVGLGKLGGGRIAALFAVLVAIALCILPTIIMLEFIPSYISVWETILQAWSDFWFKVVYGIAQCLVNALSFGSPFYFIFHAAQQYDRGLYGQVYTSTPTTKIRIGEILLFAIFVALYLPPIPTPLGIIPFANRSDLFTNLINWISLSIVGIMILIKWRVGESDNSTFGGVTNILVVGMFLVVEIFFKTSLIIVTLIIWLAFFIFAAVAAANFARASPRELY
ncbi:MAG: conserved membrane protein of unknown function [Candidatus Thorarchaeota archaeon]|nr:MAG: conserved membrane protein of unknown function [Candidatus Thorarchaeota archaeon]